MYFTQSLVHWASKPRPCYCRLSVCTRITNCIVITNEQGDPTSATRSSTTRCTARNDNANSPNYSKSKPNPPPSTSLTHHSPNQPHSMTVPIARLSIETPRAREEQHRSIQQVLPWLDRIASILKERPRMDQPKSRTHVQSLDQALYRHGRKNI